MQSMHVHSYVTFSGNHPNPTVDMIGSEQGMQVI